LTFTLKFDMIANLPATFEIINVFIRSITSDPKTFFDLTV